MELNLFTPWNLNITIHSGCNNCFIKGKCPIRDDTSLLLNEMKKSDLIIIGSPVYLHSFSGIIKSFIDHIAW
ncbi:flavodoxin family protein [Bacillus cereus]